MVRSQGLHPWLQTLCISQPYRSTHKSCNNVAGNVRCQILLFPWRWHGMRDSKPCGGCGGCPTCYIQRGLEPRAPSHVKPPPSSVTPPQASGHYTIGTDISQQSSPSSVNFDTSGPTPTETLTMCPRSPRSHPLFRFSGAVEPHTQCDDA